MFLRGNLGEWQKPVVKPDSLLSETRFRFCNEEHECCTGGDWNRQEWSRLWLYNLHYFDFLSAETYGKEHFQEAIIRRWVAENPPPSGAGWEPYTISRRAVNWLKWVLAGHRLPEEAVQSLGTQLRFLNRRLEYHLLANHLLANAKALVFGGVMFEGLEAENWLKKGLAILQSELPEQVLGDGGHVERSPMYHAIVLEDVLDLLNLGRAADLPMCGELARYAESMLQWLSCMVHPDGEIALFNDAALGVAPNLGQLCEYAQRLGVRRPVQPEGNNRGQNIDSASHVYLQESGYIRFGLDDLTVIADIGALGPDYQPGHAHADTLSFEASVGKQRLFVDSGTSCYEGAQRLAQRQTAAHNTVIVDGADSSEVWDSHRVARRARVHDVATGINASGNFSISAAHDGFRRLTGVGMHRRTWELLAAGLKITDEVEGRGNHVVCIRFHVHPAVKVEIAAPGLVRLAMPAEREIILNLDPKLDVDIQAATYNPQFGVSINNYCVVGLYDGNLPLTLETVIRIR
jgi:uncharacterized heparinase superfamily protein